MSRQGRRRRMEIVETVIDSCTTKEEKNGNKHIVRWEVGKSLPLHHRVTTLKRQRDRARKIPSATQSKCVRFNGQTSKRPIHNQKANEFQNWIPFFFFNLWRFPPFDLIEETHVWNIIFLFSWLVLHISDLTACANDNIDNKSKVKRRKNVWANMLSDSSRLMDTENFIHDHVRRKKSP